MRFKGLKSAFSQSPVDYKKLRKDDVKTPKSGYLKKHNSRTFTISESRITEIKADKNSSKIILFVHGGAFVSGPGQHHWDSVEQISKQTAFTVWLCDYPKAPESDIKQISENIDAIYTHASSLFKPENIILLGDSAGGTLIAALIGQLEKHQVPAKVILISPVLDATFKNPKIDVIDKTDPMLSKAGVLSAKEMAAEKISLSDPMLSPTNCQIDPFPPIALFIASNDITSPDQEIFVKKLTESNVKHTVYRGDGMPHIWPLLPLMKESKEALKQIIDEIMTV